MMIDVKIVAISVSRLVIVAAGITSLAMMGRLISAEEIGKYYYLVAISSILSTILLTPFGSYWEAKSSENKDEFLLSFITQFIQTILVILVVFILLVLFSNEKHVDVLLILLFGGSTYLLSNACHQMNLNNMQVFAAMMAALGASINIGVLYTSSQFFKLDGMYWACSIISSNISCFIIITFRVVCFSKAIKFKELLLKIRNNMTIDTVHFLLPILIVTSLVWGQQQLFRVIVEGLSGLEFLGVLSYALAVSIAAYSACDSIFQQIILPKTIARISVVNDMKDKLRIWRCNYYSAQFIVSVFIVSGIATCSKTILTYIGDGNYANYWFIVVVGAVIEMVKSNINARYLFLRLVGRPKSAIIPNLFLGLLLSASCFVLLYEQSYIYLTLSMLVSYLVSLCIFKLRMKSIFKDKSSDFYNKFKVISLVFVFTVGVINLQSVFNQDVISILSSLFLIFIFSIWFNESKNDYL